MPLAPTTDLSELFGFAQLRRPNKKIKAAAAKPGQTLSHDELLRLYEQMVLIREFEGESERQYLKANIGGYCHLSSGQEVATVGVVAAMQSDDLLVTGYRSHGFALARGVPAESVMAELFGKATGCARGRGGSMHLLDVARSYYGSWGIVAGQMPVAAGLALALVRQGEPQAVVCELGDGAVNMGAWHETLNLAAIWNLPIVFMVVNNGYGMGTSVERASAEPEIYKRASAFRIEGRRVDGNDLDQTYSVASELLEKARSERKPAVLEVMTYRFRGHSVADAGLAYRSKAEIEDHVKRDPLLAVEDQIIAVGGTQQELSELKLQAREVVENAVKFASSSPVPTVDQLAHGVYAEGSAKQFERMQLGSPFGEQQLVFAGGLS